MIPIKNSRIPKLLSIFIRIRAITLFPFVISIDEGDDVMWNHEAIHIRQQRELWVVGFYFLYVWYWFINLLKYRSSAMAYRMIPFEIEAYTNEDFAGYLDERKKHAWKDYRDLSK